MELLYVWIKDYKNIKVQGINFSRKGAFTMTPSVASWMWKNDGIK